MLLWLLFYLKILPSGYNRSLITLHVFAANSWISGHIEHFVLLMISRYTLVSSSIIIRIFVIDFSFLYLNILFDNRLRDKFVPPYLLSCCQSSGVDVSRYALVRIHFTLKIVFRDIIAFIDLRFFVSKLSPCLFKFPLYWFAAAWIHCIIHFILRDFEVREVSDLILKTRCKDRRIKVWGEAIVYAFFYVVYS